MQDLQSHRAIVRDGIEFFALMERCDLDKQKGKMNLDLVRLSSSRILLIIEPGSSCSLTNGLRFEWARVRVE